MYWLNVGRDLVARAFNSLSGWSAGLVWLVMSCLFRFWSLIYGRPLTLTLSHGGERGQSFGCRSIAASLYWVRAGDNWLFFSHTKYSVADVARPSVVRTVSGR